MLTLDVAKRILSASEEKAKEFNIAISTVVVDANGTIVAAGRMDGAIPISPRFAYTKAFTAASFGVPTGDLEQYAEEGKPYFGLNTIFGGELTTIAGGLPIIMEGKLVGGIGVGGSMDVSQDVACAQAGLSVLK